MKKTLLIQWTSRTFLEVLALLIPRLSAKFDVVVLLQDYSTPKGMYAELDDLQNRGIIKAYFVTPNHKKKLAVQLFMKRITKQLRSYHFDVWLSGSEMQLIERYVREIILPEKCISVIFWHNMTYLLMRQQELARKLLLEINTKNGSALANENQVCGGIAFKIINKIKQAGSLYVVLKKIMTFIPRYIQVYYRLLKNRWSTFLERIVFPWIMTGKTFPFGIYDKLTQLGSGRSEFIIFTDDIEALIHSRLLQTSNVYVAQYPSYGSCKCCGSRINKNAILSALSGFCGQNRLSDEVLFLFYRDFKTVLDHTGAKSIHLRPHPDEAGKWPNHLQKYLVERGINAVLVDNHRPIREIMCNYLGLAGFASGSLRDGRASCNYAAIIGFIGISKPLFREPKFIFGKGEGIGWIEEDGTCDPDIFVRREYVPPERKNIVELLEAVTRESEKVGVDRELSGGGKGDTGHQQDRSSPGSLFGTVGPDRDLPQ